MDDKQRRDYERGQRSLLFMNASEPDFPQGSKGATLGSSLEGLLAQAAALDAVRAGSVRKRKQGTEMRDGARIKVRRLLKITADTSQGASIEHPEMKGIFKPPSKNDNDQALVAAARSAVAAAEPFAAVFTEFGLPPAHFNGMTAAADDLEIAASSQQAAVGEGVDKGAELKEVFRRMKEVIELLDPIVRNKYANDPAKLAAWESASRLERAPRRKPADDDDNDAPPPANA